MLHPYHPNLVQHFPLKEALYQLNLQFKQERRIYLQKAIKSSSKRSQVRGRRQKRPLLRCWWHRLPVTFTLEVTNGHLERQNEIWLVRLCNTSPWRSSERHWPDGEPKQDTAGLLPGPSEGPSAHCSTTCTRAGRNPNQGLSGTNTSSKPLPGEPSAPLSEVLHHKGLLHHSFAHHS